MADSVKAKFEEWKNQLLDLSGRNTLLYFKTTKRSAIELPDVRPDELFVAVAIDEGKLEFVPAPDEQGTLAETTETSSQVQVNSALQTKLNRKELATTLTSLFRKAKESTSEQGVHTLYVALGFLRWYEADQSDEAIRSPLLLMPVELERRKGGAFKLRATGEPTESNAIIAEKLRRDFGIELPEWDDEQAKSGSVTAHFAKVSRAVSNLERAIVERTCFLGVFSFAKLVMYKDLERNEAEALEHPLVRGLCGDTPERDATDYPTAGQLDEVERYDTTYHVLDADSSQREAIEAAKLGRSFVLVGPPGTGKSQTIANIIADMMANGKRVLFVSQKAAALEVVHGRLKECGLDRFCLDLHSKSGHKREVLDQLNASLQGPDAPRKQTRGIAKLERDRAALNEYAHALHTPFGAHEMPPYEAHGRLLRVPEGIKETPFKLVSTTPGSDGKLVSAAEVTRDEFSQLLDACSGLEAAAEVLQEQREHPWWGYKRGKRDFKSSQELTEALDRLSEGATLCGELSHELAGIMGGEAPATMAECTHLTVITEIVRELANDGLVAEWLDGRSMDEEIEWASEAAQQAARLKDAEQRVFDVYDDDLLDEDLAGVCSRFGEYERSWWKRTFCSRRDRKLLWKHQVAPEVRRRFPDQSVDAAFIREVFALRTWFDENNEAHAALAGSYYDGVATDWKHVAQLCSVAGEIADALDSGECPEALRELLAGRNPGGGDRARVAELGTQLAEAVASTSKSASWLQDGFDKRHRPAPLNAFDLSEASLTDMDQWAGNQHRDLNRLDEWLDCSTAVRKAIGIGLKDLVASIRRKPNFACEAVAMFEMGFLMRFIDEACAERPSLGEFNLDEMDRRVADFAKEDRKAIDNSGIRAAREITDHRGGLRATANAGQMYTLKKELGKKTRHKPIRMLMAEIPELIQKLTPCMMMSPLTVSQYLGGTERLRFDVAIFDEASQVEPADAVPAIMRAQQVVIAGDPKQLPPTAFFKLGAPDDDDESLLDPLESILDETATWLDPVDLRWHYRSRDDSLIAFSNYSFYENRLVTFPNAGASGVELGVELYHCKDGVWDRGKSRTNQVEVDEVVRIVREQRAQNPDDSIGVVTFNQPQKKAVEDAIEMLAKQHPEYEDLTNGNEEDEPFFVKALEMVQGNERETIILTIGYAPDAAGKLTMNFGPLNKEGGERRLNVAVTRARKRVLVVSSLHASDIKSGGGQGRKMLKQYLDYAERGPKAIVEATDGGEAETESWFEEVVRDKLVAAGLQVECQVGCSGYRIDLAIVDPEHPGRYLLGVECDGRMYHSAQTARDRDRLRQQVLEGLEWRILRIWSTDWIRDPKRQVDRVLDAVREETAKHEERLKTEEQLPLPTQGTERHQPDTKNAQPVLCDTPAADEHAPIELPKTAEPRYEPCVATRLRSLGNANDFYKKTEQSIRRKLKAIEQVVQEEGPVHVEVLYGRVIEAYGMGRCGHKIRAVLDQCVRTGEGMKLWRRDGGFLWPSSMKKIPVRTNEGSHVPRSIKHIAVQEIAQCMADVVEAACGAKQDELVTEVARELGFGRTGREVRDRIEQAVKFALKEGLIMRADDGGLLPRE